VKYLVTGGAGFIGFHTALRLLQRGDSVVVVDSMNDYYDVALKEARLRELTVTSEAVPGSLEIVRGSVASEGLLEEVAGRHDFRAIIHLAAQAGIRYSLVNPNAYVESNLVGFARVLEVARHSKTPHLVFASTSSVYGANRTLPYAEDQGADHPLQFYAATKRANELMAHSYSHLFRIPVTGLRFFTVYGPWGRPDMAFFSFVRSIVEGKAIRLYNFGNHVRAFTYVDDVVEAVLRVADSPAEPSPDFDAKSPNPSVSDAPYRIYNVGSRSTSTLREYVEAIESALGKKATIELLPLQPGDVLETAADLDRLESAIDFRPSVTITEGMLRFVSWYRAYYGDHAPERLLG
jgi:UDP-glucuronate 4-epimerase